MADEGTVRAVVDRVVDATTAVLLVGDEETEVYVDADELPEGAGEGSWLVVRVDEDRSVEVVGLDESGANTKRTDLEERMRRIRSRRGGRRFGR